MEPIKPGTLENLNTAQIEVKNEIQRWLKEDLQNTDPKWTDWFVLRFCRARKFDIPKIKIMIQNYLKWSKEVNLDTIGSLEMKQYDYLKELIAEGYSNVDKGGRPVYITRAKYLKVDEVFKNYTDQQLVNYYV